MQDFTRLAVTEIMYHPPDSGTTNGDELEFLELEMCDEAQGYLLGMPTDVEGVRRLMRGCGSTETLQNEVAHVA